MVCPVFRLTSRLIRLINPPVLEKVVKVNPTICIAKPFSTSHTMYLKKIEIVADEDTTTIEGVHIKSDREDRLLQLNDVPELCPVCPHKLGVELKHTDVLILNQFLRADGCLLPRRITGVCAKGQSNLSKLVHRAQRAGLMPELRPDLPNRERTSLQSSYKWKKYNIYYADDS